MSGIARGLECVLEIGLQRRRPGAAPPFTRDRVRRILVVRKDNIGDVLCTTPALRALRRTFPDAHLAILVSAHCRAAVALNPDVDEVLTYTKAKHRSGWARLTARWELIRAIRGIRRRHFDLAISMGRSFSRSSAWLAYASRTPWRLGYLAPPAHLLGFFLNLGKDGRPTALHEVDCCLELLASAGIPAQGRKLTLVPDPDVRAAVGRRLGDAGAPAGSRLALLHISNRREDRRWPLPFFARAADLLREHLGLSILLSWSPGSPTNPLFPGDDGKAEEVAAKMRMRPILLRTPTLEELIAAVSLSDLVLTTDGGLMHIAAALDVPLVVPFGGADPRHWGPVSQRSVVLQRGGRADNISVEEVVEAAAAVLSRSGGMRAPSAARFSDTMQAVPKGEG